VSDLLLRCVPDPMQGPGTSPCPTGYIVTTVDTQLPALLPMDGWSQVAAEASAALVLSYVVGFVIGAFSQYLKDATR
jgi:hypothetical protein